MRLSKRIAAICMAAWTLVAVLSLAGCGGEPVFFRPPAPPTPTTWVIVVDLSQSTIHDRKDYVASIGTLVGAVNPGDHVAVLSVEKDAVKDARYLYEKEMPVFSFSSSPTPDTDVGMYVDGYNSKESKRYEVELKAWLEGRFGDVLKKEVLAQVQRPVSVTVAGPSDLFGALYLAGRILSTAPGDKRLVVLSDGLVNYDGIDWQDKIVTRGDVKAVIKGQERAGTVPALEGTKVIFIGANAVDGRHLAALRNAWGWYIEAVGGTLGDNFERRLEIFKLEEWLKL